MTTPTWRNEWSGRWGPRVTVLSLFGGARKRGTSSPRSAPQRQFFGQQPSPQLITAVSPAFSTNSSYHGGPPVTFALIHNNLLHSQRELLGVCHLPSCVCLINLNPGKYSSETTLLAEEHISFRGFFRCLNSQGTRYIEFNAVS